MVAVFKANETRRLGWVGPTVAVVAIALASALWINTHSGKSSSPPAEAAALPAPIELAPEDIATIAPVELSRSLPLSGSLSPLVQTTIKAKVAGEVLEMTVREGQPVKRGDILARIDTRNLQAQADSQQAALDKARADTALAKLNRDNNRALLSEHFISQNAFDSVASAYTASVANTKLAEAQLRMAEINLGDAIVRAPFDGSIAQRLTQPGEKVSPDSSLFTMVNLSKMELDAPAPASEIPSVHVGQTARFTVSGFDNREFVGRVERINPLTESGSRSIMVYLSMENPDNVLHGGMFAQGSLILDKTQATLAAPTAAIQSNDGVNYSYVLNNDVIEKRNVTVGLLAPDQGMVEIRDGLQAGDRLLLLKIDDFKPGMKAKIVAPRAAVPKA